MQAQATDHDGQYISGDRFDQMQHQGVEFIAEDVDRADLLDLNASPLEPAEHVFARDRPVHGARGKSHQRLCGSLVEGDLWRYGEQLGR
jgi:hypothetical protein